MTIAVRTSALPDTKIRSNLLAPTLSSSARFHSLLNFSTCVGNERYLQSLVPLQSTRISTEATFKPRTSLVQHPPSISTSSTYSARKLTTNKSITESTQSNPKRARVSKSPKVFTKKVVVRENCECLVCHKKSPDIRVCFLYPVTTSNNAKQCWEKRILDTAFIALVARESDKDLLVIFTEDQVESLPYREARRAGIPVLRAEHAEEVFNKFEQSKSSCTQEEDIPVDHDGNPISDALMWREKFREFTLKWIPLLNSINDESVPENQWPMGIETIEEVESFLEIQPAIVQAIPAEDQSWEIILGEASMSERLLHHMNLVYLAALQSNGVMIYKICSHKISLNTASLTEYHVSCSRALSCYSVQRQRGRLGSPVLLTAQCPEQLRHSIPDIWLQYWPHWQARPSAEFIADIWMAAGLDEDDFNMSLDLKPGFSTQTFRVKLGKRRLALQLCRDAIRSGKGDAQQFLLDGGYSASLVEILFDTEKYRKESILKFVCHQFQRCTLWEQLTGILEEFNFAAASLEESCYRALKCSMTTSRVPAWLLEDATRLNLRISYFYALSRPGEMERRDNTKLLYHSSARSNFLGLLSRGLLLPRDVVDELGSTRTDGGTLGWGIYFTPDLEYALKHCKDDNGRFWVILAEVALGETASLDGVNPDVLEPPQGYSSTSTPDRSEFAIYDVSRQRCKYLVEIVSSDTIARQDTGDMERVMSILKTLRGVEVTSREQEIDASSRNSYDGMQDGGDSYKFGEDSSLQVDYDESDESESDDEEDEAASKTDTKYCGVFARLSAGLSHKLGKPENVLASVSLPLKTLNVTAEMRDLAVSVKLIQVYRNPYCEPLEAKYAFNLGAGAAVCGFEAHVNGKRIVGRLKEKAAARKEYREAVARGDGAYLMEEDESDRAAFSVSIGNLPPNSDVVIQVEYVMELKGPELELELPHQLAPERRDYLLTDATQLTLETVAVGDCTNWNISVSLQAPTRITSLQASFAEGVTAKHTDTMAMVAVNGGKRAFTGFKLKVDVENNRAARMWVEESPDSNISAAMLLYYPTKQQEAAEQEYSSAVRYIYLFDCSNSMSYGDVCDLSTTVYSRLMPKLSDESRLVIAFGSSWRSVYADERLPCNLGSSSLLRCLAALSLINQRRTLDVVVISDGHVDAADSLTSIQLPPHMRLSALSLGQTANVGVMRALAHRGGGSHYHWSSKADKSGRQQVADLFTRLSTPAATELSITWQDRDNVPVTPRYISSVFTGERLLVFGLVENCLVATLAGKFGDKHFTQIVSTQPMQVSRGTMLHTLSANAFITDHLDGIRSPLQPANAELERKKERSHVVELSLAYNVLSPYTSFIGIEERDGTPSPDWDSSRVVALLSTQSDVLATQIYVAASPQGFIVKPSVTEPPSVLPENTLVSSPTRVPFAAELLSPWLKTSLQVIDDSRSKVYYINRNGWVGGVRGVLRDLTGIPSNELRVRLRGGTQFNMQRLEPGRISFDDGGEIYVRTLTGKTVPVVFDSGTSVADLKLLIQEKDGIPPDQQRLVFAGVQLEDHVLLIDYGFEAGVYVHLVLRLRGGRASPLVKKLDRRSTLVLPATESQQRMLVASESLAVAEEDEANECIRGGAMYTQEKSCSMDLEEEQQQMSVAGGSPMWSMMVDYCADVDDNGSFESAMDMAETPQRIVAPSTNLSATFDLCEEVEESDEECGFALCEDPCFTRRAEITPQAQMSRVNFVDCLRADEQPARLSVHREARSRVTTESDSSDSSIDSEEMERHSRVASANIQQFSLSSPSTSRKLSMKRAEITPQISGVNFVDCLRADEQPARFSAHREARSDVTTESDSSDSSFVTSKIEKHCRVASVNIQQFSLSSPSTSRKLSMSPMNSENTTDNITPFDIQTRRAGGALRRGEDIPLCAAAPQRGSGGMLGGPPPPPPPLVRAAVMYCAVAPAPQHGNGGVFGGPPPPASLPRPYSSGLFGSTSQLPSGCMFGAALQSASTAQQNTGGTFGGSTELSFDGPQKPPPRPLQLCSSRLEEAEPHDLRRSARATSKDRRLRQYSCIEVESALTQGDPAAERVSTGHSKKRKAPIRSEHPASSVASTGSDLRSSSNDTVKLYGLLSATAGGGMEFAPKTLTSGVSSRGKSQNQVVSRSRKGGISGSEPCSLSSRRAEQEVKSLPLSKMSEKLDWAATTSDDERELVKEETYSAPAILDGLPCRIQIYHNLFVGVSGSDISIYSDKRSAMWTCALGNFMLIVDPRPASAVALVLKQGRSEVVWRWLADSDVFAAIVLQLRDGQIAISILSQLNTLIYFTSVAVRDHSSV